MTVAPRRAASIRGAALLLVVLLVLAHVPAGAAEVRQATVQPAGPASAVAGPQRALATTTFVSEFDLFRPAAGTQVRVVEPDGSLRRVTGGAQDRLPSWSPDGERLSFSQNRSVFVVQRDGSGERGVLEGAELDEQTWDPGGTRVLAVATEAGTSAVVHVDVDTGAVATLFTAPVGEVPFGPRWSPDGSRVAFVGPDPDSGVFALLVVDADGTDLQRLTPADVEVREVPLWSLDGATIAVVGAPTPSPTQDQLLRVAADGTGLRTRIDLPVGPAPTVSPPLIVTHWAVRTASWSSARRSTAPRSVAP